MNKKALLTAALATLITTGLASNAKAEHKKGHGHGKKKDHASCKGNHGCKGEKEAPAAPAEGAPAEAGEGQAH